MTASNRLQVAAVVALLAMPGVVACDDRAPQERGTGSSNGLTKPGSTLEVGDKATVTRDGADEVLGVTITQIDEGSAADLADVDRSSPRAGTPYYVHYQLQHVSGPSPYLSVSDFLSAWSVGTQLTMVDIAEPFSRCEERTFRADTPVGTTVLGCATFLVEDGDAALDRVQLSYGDDYDSFDGHQVSWER
jgi:hypothetical protein